MLSAKLWFLRQLEADSRLPSDVLGALKTEGRLERWGHGAKIYHDPGAPELYMVMGGQVIVDDATPAGALLLRRGDLFGGTEGQSLEGATSLQAPTLRAVDDTTLLALDADVFRGLTADHLGSLQVRSRLFGNSRLLEVPVMPLLGTPPASRLARVLLHLIEVQGSVEGDRGIFGAPLKGRILARLTGLDRSRIALLLDLFRANDLVRFTGRKAIAPSIEALQGWALGNSPPTV